MIGASTGLFGAVWAQAEARKVLDARSARDVLERELPVGQADGAFGADGALRDPALRPRSPRSSASWSRDARVRRRAGRGGGMMHGAMEELPLIELPTEQTERADAAAQPPPHPRGRRPSCSPSAAPSCVSMQDVAQAAGVGMGTMYRRFGDRAGLTFALLGERHRAFQERAAARRAAARPRRAAARAAARLRPRRLELLDDGEARRCCAVAGRARRRSRGPDGAYRTHLAVLLREAAPAIDVEYAVDIAADGVRRAPAPPPAPRARLAAGAHPGRLVRARRRVARRRARRASLRRRMSPIWIWMQVAIVVFVLAGIVIAIVKLV